MVIKDGFFVCLWINYTFRSVAERFLLLSLSKGKFFQLFLVFDFEIKDILLDIFLSWDNMPFLFILFEVIYLFNMIFKGGNYIFFILRLIFHFYHRRSFRFLNSLKILYLLDFLWSFRVLDSWYYLYFLRFLWFLWFNSR